MATALATTQLGDIEQGITSHRRSSAAGDGEDFEEEEETDPSSDEETASSSADSCTVDKEEVAPSKEKRKSRPSSASSASSSSSSCYLSECSVEDEVVDLEMGGGNGGGGEVAAAADAAVVEGSKVMSVHSSKVERDCRICHLSLDGSNPESGFPIELGCSCKEDLAAAHKHCAEAWFKIRGNKTCEICGSTARNVVGVNEVELMEQWSEANDTAATAALPPHPAETRHFWQGHRFLNFLLACMVFAFVISWLFHFNVPS